MPKTGQKVDIRALENTIVEILTTGAGLGKKSYNISREDDSLRSALHITQNIEPDADSFQKAINNLVTSGIVRLRVTADGGIGHDRKQKIELRVLLELNR